MSFNLTAGNPRAHRVRVRYLNASSNTIYEGMPLCYNYDTTTNWFGGSMSNGAVTASTTLTAGTPSTGSAKHIEVEDPSTTNLAWFAGVVAPGGWCGKADARQLDIYVPNGAIVPVRADISCTEGRTILCLEDSSQALTQLYSANYTSRPVAIAMETVDRSTAGLILAKLDPNIFICQDLSTASALIIATTGSASCALNRINVTTAATSGEMCAFEVKMESTGGVNSPWGLAGYFRSRVSATLTDEVSSVGVLIDIRGGTPTSYVTALKVKTVCGSSATMTSCANLSVLQLTSDVDVTGPTPFSWIYLAGDGTVDPNYFLYVKSAGELGDHASAGNAPAWAAGDRMIPISFGGNVYYLIAYADSAAS